jgi:hypothetical protein
MLANIGEVLNRIELLKIDVRSSFSGDGLNTEDCTAGRSTAGRSAERRSDNFKTAAQTKSPDVLWDHPGL